jgi:hypothetical protein
MRVVQVHGQPVTNGYDTASVLLFGGTAGAVTVGDV